MHPSKSIIATVGVLLLMGAAGRAPVLPAPRLNPSPKASASPLGFPKQGFPLQGSPKPGASPRAGTFPTFQGFGSPKPTPTPKPPRAMIGPWIVVNAGGVSQPAKRLRYGDVLRLRTTRGYKGAFTLFIVNPTAQLRRSWQRPLSQFPAKLSQVQKVAWLGDMRRVHHQHWPIGVGPTLDLQPEAFLALSDDLNGRQAGYVWPMTFLFYVGVPDGGRYTYHKLVVTLDR